MKRNISFTFLILFLSICQLSVLSQTVYLQENIQNWTNRTKYGNYTQIINIASVEDSILLTNCIVSNAAAASGACSVGRIQLKEAEGSVQLPELPPFSTIELSIIAGGADRTVKLQKLNGTLWDDVEVIEDISKEGKIFTYVSTYNLPAVYRIAFPSKVIYIHDIIVKTQTSSDDLTNPYLTVTRNKSSILKANIGESCSDTIRVYGENLTADVNLQITGNGKDKFTLNKTKLTSESGVVDSEVIITFSPTEALTDTIKFIASSNGADSKEIELVGMASSLTGDGSNDNPFTVFDIKTINNSFASNTKYWVCGYIVGIPSAGNTSGNLTSVRTEPPFSGKTAIALADIPNETDLMKMIGVQLPTGDIREVLNLEDHPNNLTKKVLVYGTLEPYFSQAPGVKNISSYAFVSTSLAKNHDFNYKINRVGDMLMIDSEHETKMAIYDLTGNLVVNTELHVGINSISFKKEIQCPLIIKIGDEYSKIFL